MKSSFFYLSVILCGTLLLQVHCALEQRTVKQFQTGPFTFSPVAGIYNLTGLGFDSIPSGLSILGFGDFNSDKYTDVVAVTTDNKILCLFLWDHGNYTFQNTQNITFTNAIVGAIPADINYDGLVDIVVMTKNADGYNYFVYTGTRSNTPFNTANYALTFTYPAPQAFIAYLDDTFKPSFIVMNNGVRTVVSFKTDDQNVITKTEQPFSAYASTTTGCLPYAQVQGSTIQNPNFNAFIDLNADCRSDLFIMTTNNGQQYFEIWMRDPTSATFCLVENSPVKATVASLGFADINGDALVDLVYIQQDAEPIVHIIYNQLKNDSRKACDGFPLPLLPYINTTVASRKDVYDATASNDATQVYTLQSLGFTADTKLFAFDAVDKPHQLRFGDINMDGNPDVLITTTSAKGRKTTVLYNKLVASSQSTRQLTTSKPDDMETDVNNAIDDSNSIYAAFFDFDEIGTQSLIYVKASATGQTSIEGYYNNLNQASFFLKALGLDGAQANSSDFFAGMYYGSSFECSVTDINGTNILRKGIQLTKGGFNALQLPYAFLGLGKTNNYIENFVYGYAISGGNTHLWSPIIPNSQLIISPTGTDASGWKIDVFVKPTSNTLIVVITTAAILIILGMVICYLHYKEKEEDKQHQEKYLHLLG